MAEKSDNGSEEKKDRILVLKLISEGETRVKDLRDALDWTQERLEKTLKDLKEHDYVKSAQEGSKDVQEQVLKITDEGREEIPKMMKEIAEDTRKFLQNVSETFDRRLGKIFPKVRVKVEIERDEED